MKCADAQSSDSWGKLSNLCDNNRIKLKIRSQMDLEASVKASSSYYYQISLLHFQSTM